MSETHDDLDRRLARSESTVDRLYEKMGRVAEDVAKLLQTTSNPAQQDEVRRRLARLELSEEKLEKRLTHMADILSRLSQLVEIHATIAPEVQQMRIDLSNAKLVQKGYIWVTGVVSSSAIAIALTFLSERLL